MHPDWLKKHENDGDQGLAALDTLVDQIRAELTDKLSQHDLRTYFWIWRKVIAVHREWDRTPQLPRHLVAKLAMIGFAQINHDIFDLARLTRAESESHGR